MELGLGLLVLGVATPGNRPIFCYAQLLDRPFDNDRYPPPLLPRSVGGLEHEVLPGADGRFVVHVWERQLRDEEKAQVDADLAAGRLRLPSDCPIEGGAELSGPLLPPSVLHEKSDLLPPQGVGAVTSLGFVVEAAAGRIIQTLGASAEAALDLPRLLEALDAAAGLGGLFARSRRLGVIERLSRIYPEQRGTLLLVRPVKPDVDGNDPCRAITLQRTDAAPAKDLHLVVRAEAWKTITFEKMLILPADSGATTVDAGSHVTGIDILVFDPDSGDLLEQQRLSLAQSFSLSLTAVGLKDHLPTPFKAAPPSPDLTQRPRLNSSQTAIQTPGRAPGLEALRRNSLAMEDLIGTDSWKPESRFFETGIEPQLDVIRWIKAHMEAPGTVEAFLVDPYLGSQAFERVVLRQGNENVKLTVVVSPADVDPDAMNLDAKSIPGGHVEELVRTAERHASKLCGEITLIHVKRGGGVRQAFHDRYLGLVQQQGPPRVFLLSNSLSKAAGDWPFTAAEVDAPSAWAIASYIGDLTQTADSKRLTAEVVWRSTDVGDTDPSPPEGRPSEFETSLWEAYLALFPLLHDSEDVQAAHIVTELAKTFPADAPTPKLARAIVDGMHGRLSLAGAAADAFAALGGSDGLAEAIEDAIVDDTLAELAPRSGSPPQWVPDESTLRRAGRRLGQRSGGTNLVRSRMNPALHRYSCLVERDRQGVVVHQALQAALAIIVVGQELAANSDGLQVLIRNGIAVDYAHGLGRILRTPIAESALLRQPGDLSHPAEFLHRLAARQARALAESLGGDVRAAYQKLATDPLIHHTLLEPPEPRRLYSGLAEIDPLVT